MERAGIDDHNYIGSRTDHEELEDIDYALRSVPYNLPVELTEL